MSNRQRISRQNGPGTAAALASDAVSRLIVTPARQAVRSTKYRVNAGAGGNARLYRPNRSVRTSCLGGSLPSFMIRGQRSGVSVVMAGLLTEPLPRPKVSGVTGDLRSHGRRGQETCAERGTSRRRQPPDCEPLDSNSAKIASSTGSHFSTAGDEGLHGRRIEPLRRRSRFDPFAHVERRKPRPGLRRNAAAEDVFKLAR